LLFLTNFRGVPILVHACHSKRILAMKKIKSMGIFDIKDFPINFVRTGILKGTGADVEELGEKPLIAVVNSYTELNPSHSLVGVMWGAMNSSSSSRNCSSTSAKGGSGLICCPKSSSQ
jgi:dihydroxyacid dehydratase/phosphogluconate dehydratase